QDFESLQDEITKALDGLESIIEHVGSTAVPNLDAKAIIDIDIVFSQKADFEQIKAALMKIGYDHHGNQGIADRYVFKRNGGQTHEILDQITHHLYVCPADSKALERHLLSRNYLRNNEWARLKYQQMKYELAEQANQDKKKYAALKELYVNDFIDMMVEEEKKLAVSTYK
ncbi:MAG TPA: GrpB family protein, partial [Saprospiraceae bacterium]|nr:GrpB family protein [Saprospiraceae bacterium]